MKRRGQRAAGIDDSNDQTVVEFDVHILFGEGMIIILLSQVVMNHSGDCRLWEASWIGRRTKELLCADSMISRSYCSSGLGTWSAEMMLVRIGGDDDSGNACEPSLVETSLKRTRRTDHQRR